MNMQTTKTPLLFVLAILAIALSGCASVKKTDAINFLVPSGGYTKQQVSYGSDKQQSFDLYLPKTSATKIPVVYVYGSAWKTSFNKSDFVFVAQALTSLGHPVIVPEHRRYPEVKFPVFVEDVADAISYVDRNSIGLPKPFTEFILMGHSSGAHTAALLATDQRYFNQRQVKARLKGLIAMSGPYDLPMNDPEVAAIFDTTTAQRAKPVLNVRPNMPPTLLLHGLADPRVPPYHASRFRDALLAKGNDVTMKLYPGVDHEKLLGGIAKPLRYMSNSFVDVREFLKRYN
ncbi:alpha/beta hydrolase [Leucothrix arctica]|nr:alpha/beta hydrolase [Leucothrix arctica]